MAIGLAFLYFTTLTAAFLWKLLPMWNLLIPGGLQDTRLFLWNGWWFQYAISLLHSSPYETALLFHPFGVNLVSHDFPLWMNLITWAGQSAGLSLVSASNIWFAASWMLSGFATYLLAMEVTGKPAASIVAGTYVMTHSYTLARAMQNWGQFNLYGIAFFLWCLLRARRQPTKRSLWILAGIALAWTAACHYYFLIYAGFVWMLVVSSDILDGSLQLGWHKDGRKRLRQMLLILAAMTAIIAMGIAIHPTTLHGAGMTISMQSSQNMLFLMWIFLWILGFTYVEIKRKGTPGRLSFRSLKPHLLLGCTALVCLSPLFWGTFRLLQAGGYPKQSILWKTHLPGANLLAVFGPNPIQAFWGPLVSRWYWVRGMNPQEQAAAIGWVALVVIIAAAAWRNSGQTRRWLALAAGATLLAMGTHLHIAQDNLWCPLPFFGVRLLPIFGNVRVPERWMALGAVAWGVTLALSLCSLSIRKGWKLWKVSALAAALVLLENWPGIPFVPTRPVSPVYERLRGLEDGAVLPVPLYIGDSSIGAGNSINGEFIFPWDHLWAQTTHHKPIVGGYIGRISKNLIKRYKEDLFTRTLLTLEENPNAKARPDAAAGLAAIKFLKINYLLVYPTATTPEVLRYVLGSLPLEAVDHDGSIQLYRVDSKQTQRLVNGR